MKFATIVVLAALLLGPPEGVRAASVMGADPGTVQPPVASAPAPFSATWYCHDGRFPRARLSRCTRGVPAGTMAVAVPYRLLRQYPKGTRVRVMAGKRYVDVRVVDVNMGPSWDLYAVAFHELARLPLGRIRVSVARLR